MVCAPFFRSWTLVKANSAVVGLKGGFYPITQGEVGEGEKDLSAASHHCIAHGSLLSLRYVLSEVPWAAIARQPARGAADMRPRFKALLQSIFQAVRRVAAATLPVLALYEETYLGAPC